MGWLEGETTVGGVCGGGVGDAEDGGESPGVSQVHVSMSTSSDGRVGTGMRFGFDGKAEM